MADKEVTSKLILQGDPTNLVNAMRISEAKAKEMHTSMAGAIESITQAHEGLVGGFEKVGAAAAAVMAIVAGGKMFGEMVTEAVSWNAQATKLSATLGMTTQEAAEFKSMLEHLGIEQDVATGAMQKMIKAATSSPQVFDDLKIKITGLNGELLPTSVMFQNVISRLGEFEGGSSRAAAASLIFGKGTKELSQLMKITAEEAEGAKERIEALGTAVTEEGSKKAVQYKKDMADLKEVFGAVAFHIGSELIPPLSRLAKTMVDFGEHHMKDFRDAMLNTEIGAYKLAQGLDVIGWSAAKAGAIISGGDLFGKNPWNVHADEFGKRFDDSQVEIQKIQNRLAGLNEDGSEIKPYKAQSNGDEGLNPNNLHKSLASDKTAIFNKELEYWKAFDQRILAETKSANDLGLTLNQNAYALGLTDLDTFLNEKNRLIQANLTADIKAKKDDLSAAQELMNKALNTQIYKTENKKKVRDTDKETAEQIAAATKLEQAQGAYNAALANQIKTTEEQKQADLDRIYTSTRGYKEQQAALADYQGDIVKAALIRKALDEQSRDRGVLESNAAKGDMEAEKALTALKIMDIGKISMAEANAKAKKLEDTVYGPAKKQQAAIGGDNYGSQYGNMLIDFEKEKAAIQAQYDAKIIMEEEYQAKMRQAKETFSTQQTGMELSMASESIGIMKQAFAGNKTAMIAAMVAEKAIAIARIMINTEVTQSALLTAAAMQAVMVPVPGAGIAFMGQALAQAQAVRALSYVSIGLIAASGAIEGMQIAGQRAIGGPVSGGSTYLVGEKGPELFTPGSTGMITPNHQLSGSSTFAPVYNIDARNSTLSSQEITSIVTRSVEQSKAEILNNMNRGGKFALASGRVR